MKDLPNYIKPLNNADSLAFKYVALPVGRNKILIRLENIGDKFDSPETELEVGLYNLILLLYSAANDGKAELNSVNIEQVSLTGN